MTRVIYFVRHGQEQSGQTDNLGGPLSALGIEQAQLTSEYFKDVPFNNAFTSIMPRARQTAEFIIAHYHPHLKLEISELLQEGIPNIPVNYADEFPRVKKTQLHLTRCRFKQAYKTFVHPATGSDCYDLLVCHNNIIRYFLISALNAPQYSWIQFELSNCSISKIIIHSPNKILIEFVNLTSHLPKSHLTW